MSRPFGETEPEPSPQENGGMTSREQFTPDMQRLLSRSSFIKENGTKLILNTVQVRSTAPRKAPRISFTAAKGRAVIFKLLKQCDEMKHYVTLTDLVLSKLLSPIK